MNKDLFSYPGRYARTRRHSLHEYAHTGLFFVSAARTPIWAAMNPDGAHPSEALDTRAAFPFSSLTDCSVLGGAVFSPRGDGSFNVNVSSPYGYSWLGLSDGLVAPAEISQSPNLQAQIRPSLGRPGHQRPSRPSEVIRLRNGSKIFRPELECATRSMRSRTLFFACCSYCWPIPAYRSRRTTPPA